MSAEIELTLTKREGRRSDDDDDERSPTRMPVSTQTNFPPENDDVISVDEAHELIAAYDQSSTSKKKLLLQTIVALLTVFVCAGASLIVPWANEIPSVQLDFTKGTTARDLFNPNTLVPRSSCGSEAGRKAGGGLAFDAATSCWNGYFADDEWKVFLKHFCNHDSPRAIV